MIDTLTSLSSKTPEKKANMAIKSVIVIVSVAILLAPTIYFYNKYSKIKSVVEKAGEGVGLQGVDIISQVSKLIELPSGETPTIASVSDKDKLNSNPFFSNTENGDKILIYAKAKKAYLYRPSTGKLVDVTPIAIQGESDQSTSAITIE